MPYFRKGNGGIKYVESEIIPGTGIDKAREVAKQKGYDEIFNVQKDDRNVWINAKDYEGARKKGYELADVVQEKKKIEQEQIDRVRNEQKGILGTLRGALSSVARGATAGFSDELTGGLAYLTSGGKNNAQRKADYEAARNEERLNQKVFEEDHPIANFAGEMVGGLAVPVVGLAGKAALGMKVAKSAGLGAGLGALTGAGEAKDMKSIPKEALKSAVMGGAIGGAIPAVGAGGRAIYHKAKEGIAEGTNSIRNMLNPQARKAQQEVQQKLNDQDLVDYYHGGGREKFNEGAEEARNLIANKNAKQKLDKELATEYEKKNPYLLDEIREAKEGEKVARAEFNDSVIDEKINNLENKIKITEDKNRSDAGLLSLKKRREDLGNRIKELAPEILETRKTILGQRKEIGNRRDQFFDYVDAEVGQTPESVKIIDEIQNSLKKSLDDVSLVDPRIVGDYTKSAFQNQNIVENLKKGLSGEIGPGGKISPSYDIQGNLVPIESAGKALKMVADLMTTARRKAGQKNAAGEYRPSDNPEILAARRLVSRLGGNEENYLKKLGLPEESVEAYQGISKEFAKNYQAEDKVNALLGRVGKRGEYIPNESKVRGVLKDRHKNESVTRSLENINDPEVKTLIENMKNSGLEMGDIEKELKRYSLSEEKLAKGAERLGDLRKRSMLLDKKQKHQANLLDQVSEREGLQNARQDYRRLPVSERLNKLGEEGKLTPEMEKVAAEYDAIEKANRFSNQNRATIDPTKEYGKIQEASDLLEGGLDKLYQEIGPTNLAKIKDAIGPEKTAQLLKSLNNKYGLSDSSYMPTHGVAAMAGAVGGSPAYGATNMIIQHLNSTKDPFQRLANIARAKESMRQFKEKVKRGEETPQSYYKLVQAAVNAGLDITNFR